MIYVVLMSHEGEGEASMRRGKVVLLHPHRAKERYMYPAVVVHRAFFVKDVGGELSMSRRGLVDSVCVHVVSSLLFILLSRLARSLSEDALVEERINTSTRAGRALESHTPEYIFSSSPAVIHSHRGSLQPCGRFSPLVQPLMRHRGTISGKAQGCPSSKQRPARR